MLATAALYTTLIATSIGTLWRSWIGVVAYFTLSIWYPQLIWFWAFGDMRVVFIVTVLTIVGFAKDAFLGRLDFSILREKENLYIVVLWISLIASYFFSPYGIDDRAVYALNPSMLLGMINKLLFFYFIAIILIDNKQKFHYLIIIFLIITVFYVYWGNNKYFSGQMYYSPRLSGPGPEAAESTPHSAGPYTDENNFAMLFVMGIPFLYFMGNYYKNWLPKWLLWLAIPFAWHAIFLTGSLGGLIGLGVVTLFIAVRSKRKLLFVTVPIALLIAFIWQGGKYLQERVERQTDSFYVEVGESTADQRINSWEAGFRMLIDHPITGVGIGNFLRAYPDYSETTPHVAHNTFFQFASESGIFAGLMYLLLFWSLFRSYLSYIRLGPERIGPFFLATTESIMGGAVGFFVCATFLNLATYELLYYTLILHVVQKRLIESSLEEEAVNLISPSVEAA